MKREVEGRPLFVAFLGVMLGYAIHAGLLNLVLLPLCLLASSWKGRWIALISALFGYLLSPTIPQLEVFAARPFSGTVQVIEMPHEFANGVQTATVQSGSSRYTLRVRNQSLQLGDELKVIGTLRPLNEGAEGAWLSKGVGAQIVAKGLVETVQAGPPVFAASRGIRTSFENYITKTASPEAGAALAAFSFGDDSKLSQDYREQFQTSGAYHMVVASGLHVYLLAASVGWLFGFLPIPRILQIALLAFILGVFVLATGIHASVTRAAIMSIAGFSAFLLRREADPLSALALSGFCLLAIDRFSPYEAGFQISLVTIAAIIFLAPLATKGPAKGLAMSVLAMAAATPILAHYFGFISLIAFVTNLLLLPAVYCSVGLALMGWALSLPVLIHLAEPFTGWALLTVSTFGEERWTSIPVPPFSGYWLLAIYTLAIVLSPNVTRQP